MMSSVDQRGRGMSTMDPVSKVMSSVKQGCRALYSEETGSGVTSSEDQGGSVTKVGQAEGRLMVLARFGAPSSKYFLKVCIASSSSQVT